MPSQTSKNTKKESSRQRPDTQASQNPAWPLLQPLVPSDQLTLDTILERQIIVIRNFFTSKLCNKYVSFLAQLPFTTTAAKPKKGEAFRVNDRLQYDDFDFARRLFHDTGLSLLLDAASPQNMPNDTGSHRSANLWNGRVVGLNPRIRVYRYTEGQYFAQHYDESNLLNLPTSTPTPVRTTWTLLIYLTGVSTGCIGGETVFYPELGPVKQVASQPAKESRPIIVEPEVGMALLHKHGNDCLLHEGMKVTSGTKYLLRTDICVER